MWKYSGGFFFTYLIVLWRCYLRSMTKVLSQPSRAVIWSFGTPDWFVSLQYPLVKITTRIVNEYKFGITLQEWVTLGLDSHHHGCITLLIVWHESGFKSSFLNSITPISRLIKKATQILYEYQFLIKVARVNHRLVWFPSWVSVSDWVG